MIKGPARVSGSKHESHIHAGLKHPAAERRRRQHKFVAAGGLKESAKIRATEILTTLRLSIKSYIDFSRWGDFDNSYCEYYISAMRSLESYRGRDFVGVDELTSIAAGLIEQYREEPERGNVRMTITQRIVRHYLAEDLLGEPSGQAGTSTVFNYGNLVRLLAVKKLLVDNWSVVKIREFMTALDITALEQLINSAFNRTSGSNQQKKQEAEALRARAQNFRASQRRTRENRQHGAPLFAANAQPPPLASLVLASAKRAERKGEEWIEIATGLEIKVRRSFRRPRTEKENEQLVERFWAVVTRKKTE